MKDVRDYAATMSLVRYMVENDPSTLDHVHIAADFKDADFALKAKQFRVLDERDGFGRDVQAPLMGGTLTRIDGPEHFRRRRIESLLFRSPTLRSYEADVLRPALDRVLDELRATHEGSGAVRADLHDIGEIVLGEVVAAMIGLDGLSDPAERESFNSYYQDIDNGVRISWATADTQHLADVALAAISQLDGQFIQPSLERRRTLLDQIANGEAEPGEVPSDLLTIMLEHSGGEGEEHEFDPELMTREITLFLTASITTLTNQVCYAMHHIEEWVEEHPEDAPRRVDPFFLSRALQESIRLHAGPVLMRRATEDVLLPSGKLVAEGDFVWVGIREASADEEYFGTAPDEFNPYRQPAEGVLAYGLEFGVGRHTCIGKRFAIGDDPSAEEALQGGGITVLRTLYELGMRRDPDADRTFVPQLLDVHKSCPIVLTEL